MLIIDHDKDLKDGQLFYDVMESNGHQEEFTTKREAIAHAKEVGATIVDINRFNDGEIIAVSEIYLT